MKELRTENIIAKPVKNTVRENKKFVMSKLFWHRYRMAYFMIETERTSMSDEDVQLYRKYSKDESRLWLELLDVGVVIFGEKFEDNYEIYQSKKIVELMTDGYDVSHLMDYLKKYRLTSFNNVC